MQETMTTSPPAAEKKAMKPETIMGIGMFLGGLLFGGMMYAVQEWRIAGLVADHEDALRSERGAVDDLTKQLEECK
jgi:hypothetical protein